MMCLEMADQSGSNSEQDCPGGEKHFAKAETLTDGPQGTMSQKYSRALCAYDSLYQTHQVRLDRMLVASASQAP